MSCINLNNEQFQNILKDIKNPLLAEIEYDNNFKDDNIINTLADKIRTKKTEIIKSMTDNNELVDFIYDQLNDSSTYLSTIDNYLDGDDFLADEIMTYYEQNGLSKDKPSELNINDLNC